MRDGVYRRVQVKTATWSRAGRFSYLQCRTRLTNRHQDRPPVDLYDLLLIVHGDLCWAIPAALVDSSNLSLGSNNPCAKPNRWEAFQDRLCPSRTPPD